MGREMGRWKGMGFGGDWSGKGEALGRDALDCRWVGEAEGLGKDMGWGGRWVGRGKWVGEREGFGEGDELCSEKG